MPAPRIGDAPQTDLLLPEGAAETYAGQFQLAPGAIFTIRAVHRQLLVELTGQQAMPVVPDGPDAFAYDVVEARLVFQRDADGRVASLTLFQNGMELPAPRLD